MLGELNLLEVAVYKLCRIAESISDMANIEILTALGGELSCSQVTRGSAGSMQDSTMPYCTVRRYRVCMPQSSEKCSSTSRALRCMVIHSLMGSSCSPNISSIKLGQWRYRGSAVMTRM